MFTVENEIFSVDFYIVVTKYSLFITICKLIYPFLSSLVANVIFLVFLCFLKVIWSIENIKKLNTRNITLIALLINRLTLYSRK